MIKKNLGFLLLLVFFLFLFFFHLGFESLASWDEAWFAAVARYIVKTGQILNLRWNNNPFFDHPPLGMWLEAISYKLFGVSELTTRLPSAFLGVLTIIVVYATAIKLFKEKIVAFVAALIMGTSVWYVLRVRSGNLDSILVFFYILTVYLSLKSRDNFRWFPAAAASFACLMLSKTLIGASALPLILLIDFPQLIKIKSNFLNIILGVILFAVIVLPWYLSQAHLYPWFLNYHFFTIGMRKKTPLSYLNINIVKPFFYLHMGIRKWYYLWLLGSAILIISRKFLKREVIYLFAWLIFILYPFLTSEKTELWHLIPVYLPISFLTAYGIYVLLSAMFKNKMITGVFYLLFFLLIAFLQIKTFLPEVIPTQKYVPDEVDIAKRVTKYKSDIYLIDDFLPRVVFYSNRNIIPLIYDKNGEPALVKLYKSDKKIFVVVASSWMGDQLKTAEIPYKVLEKNNSFSIFSRPD